MNLRLRFLLAAVLVLPSPSFAARSPRLKDDVTKTAVGLKVQKPIAATSSDDASASENSSENENETEESSDATDHVDKPITRPSVIVTDAPRGAAPVATEASQSQDDEGEATEDEPKSDEKVETPTVAVKEKHPQPVQGVTAEQSQKWLENGNTRYVTKKFRADGRSEKDRAKKEVTPHAIVLSCFDSRVPPELIFDQGLGEITTIRVAGEVLDSSVIASIEQTILNDHPHLLVVLGHTQCESIEAVMSWKDKATYGSDALDRMVSEIKPHLKSLTPGSRSPGLQVEGALQADGVARELTDRSEMIKKAVDDGQLTIKTGLYWVDTGKVKFY